MQPTHPRRTPDGRVVSGTGHDRYSSGTCPATRAVDNTYYIINIANYFDSIAYLPRPAKSADLREFFFHLIFTPSRFKKKNVVLFPNFTGLNSNNIHSHIEVLLFSTSFVISVVFCDVKMENNRLILCHRQIKYRYIFRA